MGGRPRGRERRRDRETGRERKKREQTREMNMVSQVGLGTLPVRSRAKAPHIFFLCVDSEIALQSAKLQQLQVWVPEASFW